MGHRLFMGGWVDCRPIVASDGRLVKGRGGVGIWIAKCVSKNIISHISSNWSDCSVQHPRDSSNSVEFYQCVPESRLDKKRQLFIIITTDVWLAIFGFVQSQQLQFLLVWFNTEGVLRIFIIWRELLIFWNAVENHLSWCKEI